MSEKRMFSQKIVDSDAFLDMPLSAQALYFHLCMRADDDGFLNNANRIINMINASQNDYGLLISKKFIIQLPNGICVIKHWRINNYIRKDRYHETTYLEEKSMILVKKNGSYSLKLTVSENGIPISNQPVTESRTEENRLDESSAVTACEDFERFWSAYPKQTGRIQAEQEYVSLITTTDNLDLEQFLTAVSNYAESCRIKNTREQFIKNPANWIRESLWIDYLPENYKKPEVKKQVSSNNKFNNFNQRSYDYDNLERKLLGKG